MIPKKRRYNPCEISSRNTCATTTLVESVKYCRIHGPEFIPKYTVNLFCSDSYHTQILIIGIIMTAIFIKYHSNFIVSIAINERKYTVQWTVFSAWFSFTDSSTYTTLARAYAFRAQFIPIHLCRQYLFLLAFSVAKSPLKNGSPFDVDKQAIQVWVVYKWASGCHLIIKIIDQKICEMWKIEWNSIQWLQFWNCQFYR